MVDIAGLGNWSLNETMMGSLVQGLGKFDTGLAESNYYQYQSGVARLNQQVDLQNAEWAVQTGEQTALQFGLNSKAKMGQIISAQAASGFDVNSGSAKDVRAGQASLVNLGNTTIRSNAAQTAYGYRVSAATAEAQAKADNAASTQSIFAGIAGLGSSLIGGAGSVASMWTQASQVGLPLNINQSMGS